MFGCHNFTLLNPEYSCYCTMVCYSPPLQDMIPEYSCWVKKLHHALEEGRRCCQSGVQPFILKRPFVTICNQRPHTRGPIGPSSSPQELERRARSALNFYWIYIMLIIFHILSKTTFLIISLILQHTCIMLIRSGWFNSEFTVLPLLDFGGN